MADLDFTALPDIGRGTTFPRGDSLRLAEPGRILGGQHGGCGTPCQRELLRDAGIVV